MNDTLFYDNQLEDSADHPGLIELDRVYALNLARFSEADNLALLELYRTLPGGYREAAIAYWFGDSEESPPYLWASAEPSGLQVSGTVKPEDWAAWHAAFMRGLAQYSFPLHDF